MGVIEKNDNISSKDKMRVKKVEKAIKDYKLDAEIIWHDVEGATTADARDSLGVDASDIAKSIVFVDEDEESHMVVILGDRRIDTDKLSKIIGKDIKIARPKEVLEHTGIEVGGVNPIGCKKKVNLLLDESILEKPYVHTSAGCSYATLLIKTGDLVNYTKGQIIDVSE